MSESNKQHGFSLVEILIAISIIVILSTVVGLQLVDIPQDSRVKTARIQIESFRSAVQIYISDNGVTPTQRQGLQALVAKPVEPPVPRNYRPGGYLDSRTVPDDPWGHPYAYLVPGRNGEVFEIVCYGSDGEEGGEGYATDLSSSR